MDYKRLYRDTRHAHLGGVSAGLAEYFNTDVVLLRILFVILTVFWGGGLLIYIVFWIVVPKKPYTLEDSTISSNESSGQPPASDSVPIDYADRIKKGSMIGGSILIALGVLLIIKRFIIHLSFAYVFPILIMIVGIGIILTTFISNKKNKTT